MRKLLTVAGLALAISLVLGSTAAAHGPSSTFSCNGTFTGETFRNVVVPKDGSCTLINSTVTGHVQVRANAFFQATNTDIGRDVKADRAVTVFTNEGTTVGGKVRTHKTFQVFVFDSTVRGDIEVTRSEDSVHICGNTVLRGDIRVAGSGRDILIGDPQAQDCAGNLVERGEIEAEKNFTDVEFVIRGNTVPKDDLDVFDNKGPVPKFVQNNIGGDELECDGNSEPFTASGNTGFRHKRGQCTQVFKCEGEFTGVTLDDVVVRSNGSCTLLNSTVSGKVQVDRDAFFQATDTDIGGDVKADRAVTVFINEGTAVGGKVQTNRTFQVFLFDSTLGKGVEVRRTADTVNVCGNSVPSGDILVADSGRDILIGDPDAQDCAGNTVAQGEIEARDNFTDVEFVIRGNTIVLGDLEAFNNRGPVPKFVQNNIGGDELRCAGNQDPFTATGNTGFAVASGQCAI